MLAVGWYLELVSLYVANDGTGAERPVGDGVGSVIFSPEGKKIGARVTAGRLRVAIHRIGWQGW